MPLCLPLSTDNQGALMGGYACFGILQGTQSTSVLTNFVAAKAQKNKEEAMQKISYRDIIFFSHRNFIIEGEQRWNSFLAHYRLQNGWRNHKQHSRNITMLRSGAQENGILPCLPPGAGVQPRRMSADWTATRSAAWTLCLPCE